MSASAFCPQVNGCVGPMASGPLIRLSARWATVKGDTSVSLARAVTASGMWASIADSSAGASVSIPSWWRTYASNAALTRYA